MIDDVTLWSKLESNFNAFLLILFHRRAILKTLALEQSTDKWPCSAGEGSFDRSDPLGYGPESSTNLVWTKRWCSWS